MLLIPNYIFIIQNLPYCFATVICYLLSIHTTGHFVSRETKKPLTALLLANLLSGKGWLSVLPKCKDQLSFKCQSTVTLTKSFWQRQSCNTALWNFPMLQGIQVFQLDQLTQINKKIVKSLKNTLEAIRKQQMFCNAAILGAHAAHIIYTDFAD